MKLKRIIQNITLAYCLFLVPLSFAAGVFNFNDGTTQGWTLDQMYKTSSQAKFSPVSGFALMNSSNELAAYAGNLLIGNTDQNDIYLESPDLTSNNDWQNIEGYRLDVKRTLWSPCFGDVPNTFFVQLQMRVIDTSDGNKEKLFAEYSGGNYVFHEILTTSKLYQFTWKPDWLADSKYKVKKIRIRITGPGDVAKECWYRGSWNIDNVTAEGGSSSGSIKVTTPNGGEKWNVGSPRIITWSGQGIDNKDVKIEYSTDNGASYTFVDYKTNQGTSDSYNWTIPNTPSKDCFVRLSVTDPAVSDVSDAAFEITSSGTESIKLNVPNGGEDWAVGSKRYIVWNCVGFSGPVKIEYSTNGGANYTTIENTYSGGSSYEWTVPNTPSTNCVVKVSDAGDGQPWDISDAVFKISATISNNTPSGSNILVDFGAIGTITFNQVINPGNTDIEYIPDGPEPPEKHEVIPQNNPYYYHLSTSAVYAGDIQLALKYDDTELNPDQEMALQLFHFDDSTGDWLGITTHVEIEQNIISGVVSDLSIFAIMLESGAAGDSGTIVTNCEDSGLGSLRDAINFANSNPGPDLIEFNLSKDVPGYDSDIGVWAINPETPLPAITDAGTIINGFSQAEFLDDDANPNGPEIWLDGTIAGNYTTGLDIKANGCEILGLIISNFQSTGISVEGVEGGRISGCFMGTDFSGIGPAANGYGIYLGHKTVGFVISPQDDIPNVISGNTNLGICISDTSHHNAIIGNIIGLDRTGQYGVPNGNYGGICLQFESYENEIFDNQIGGNNNGIYLIKSHHNQIGNNAIGTNFEWEIEAGNTNDGIIMSEGSRDNHIFENTIGYNGGAGVHVYGSTTIQNRISRNSISENAYSGIFNDNGGNNTLARPVLTSVSKQKISGTAPANVTIEIYTDPDTEGRMFHGETTTDASGNFTWEGEIESPYSHVSAIAIDSSGNTSGFSIAAAIVTNLKQADEISIPKEFSLSQNYPNPFNPDTEIHFEIPFVKTGTVPVLVKIFNLQGELVKTLVDSDRAPGSHTVRWYGFTASGEKASSGIYFYRISAGEFTATRKMVLMK